MRKLKLEGSIKIRSAVLKVNKNESQNEEADLEWTVPVDVQSSGSERGTTPGNDSTVKIKSGVGS